MKSAILLGVCLFALCASQESPTCDHFTAYTLVRTRKSFLDARAYCGTLGGKLAEPMNAAQNTFVSKVAKMKRAYIGFNDIRSEGTFVSSSGEAISYSNWRDNQPDNGGENGSDCAVINAKVPEKWADNPCDKLRRFVCEVNLPV